MRYELDDIPLRVHRNGRWQSLCIGSLSFLSDAEIENLAWAHKLLEMLESDPRWVHVDREWLQEYPG